MIAAGIFTTLLVVFVCVAIRRAWRPGSGRIGRPLDLGDYFDDLNQ